MAPGGSWRSTCEREGGRGRPRASGPRRRVGTVYLILQLAGGRANEVKTILREVID